MKPPDWDNVAQAYAAMSHESRHLVVFPVLLDLLEQQSPKRILDVGGGDGRFAEAAARRLPQSSVDAWDSSPAMTALALERARESKSFRVLQEKPPLCTYDAVILTAVWMGWETDEQCEDELRQLAESATDDGILLITVTHPCFRQERFSTFSTDFALPWYFDNGRPFTVHVEADNKRIQLSNTHWNLSAMSGQLSAASLNIERLHELPDLPSSVGDGGSPWLVVQASRKRRHVLDPAPDPDVARSA
ncbi:MAG: Methyltransferase domain [Gemmatimonadetes bacterium]|nr:Methyltransferase domain [Gemmatimonadota bacterium]